MEDEMTDSRSASLGRFDVAYCAIIISAAMLIGLHNIADSGPQWLEDGPRYANNGAMVHDWLMSGRWGDPVEFAKENYLQYPAHSVPYHPPGYAFLLGVWFILTGMSYASARCFIAVCLGLAGCAFYGVLRAQKMPRWAAFAGTLMFVTTPEVAHWARCTMSEIPALAAIIAASFCFIRWVDCSKVTYIWAAFALAGLAFFCRVTSCGVLPAWFLYAVAVGGIRRLRSANLIVCAVIYLTCAVAWSKFASLYASYEVRESASSRILNCLSSENLSVWLFALPGMVGSLSILAAAWGTGITLGGRHRMRLGLFWIGWFVTYYAFQVALNIHFEARYFIFAVPAVCALGTVPLAHKPTSRYWMPVATAVFTSAIVVNVVGVVQMPRGLRGYDVVANELAQLDQPGNILSSLRNFSDLVFRLRCEQQRHQRRIIRSDRTLAIRVSDYAGVAPKTLATNSEDVLEVVRKGRIRYVLTSPYIPHRETGEDVRPDDMVLAHNTALTDPASFTLLRRFNLHNEVYGEAVSEEVWLWRFEGELQPGESEIPAIIPTANLIIETNREVVE